MSSKRWMLYGATGYTGKLLVQEAVKRGLSPVIAGRDESKVRALAERYSLEAFVFPVHHAGVVEDGINAAEVDAVLHAAGPFTFTAVPMRQACLRTKTHYLDITGEISVFEDTFAQDEAAQQAGILLMSGVGFDIVPSDCLIRYVADALPNAVELEVAIAALGADTTDGGLGITAGTLKSLLEMLPKGNMIRRGGRIIPADFGKLTKTVQFPHGRFNTLSIPWGDVSTGYHTSGIPNITAYMALPAAQITGLAYSGVALQWLMKFDGVRQGAGRIIDRVAHGPTDSARQTERAHIYVKAQDAAGQTKEAWLETMEGYALTAQTALMAVERALTGDYIGAQTPARAFGADFVLEADPSARRSDTL